MKLLILDIDETLVYSTEEPLPRPHDLTVGPYYVYKRPYLDEFIRFCFEHFQVAIWTSSSLDYAIAIIKQLFIEEKVLQFIFARNRCTRRFDFDTHEEYYVKDLRKIKKRGFELKDTIMLDDTPKKLERQYGNLLSITEWLGDSDDRELLVIQKFLLTLKNAPNIRYVEKRCWQQSLMS